MMKGQILPATVTDWKWTQAASAGLRVWCDVEDPNGLEEPKRLDGTIWFSEKAMGMAKRQLKNLGVDMDAKDFNLALLGADFDIIGNKLEVQIDEFRDALKIGFFGVMNAIPKPEALKAIGEALKNLKADKRDEHDEPAPKIPKEGTKKKDVVPF